jgi:hypothetical protein
VIRVISTLDEEFLQLSNNTKKQPDKKIYKGFEQIFFQRRYANHVNNKHKERCSTSLVFKEYKSKPD